MSCETEIINIVAEKIDECVSFEDLELIKKTIRIVLSDYTITKKETAIAVLDDDNKSKALRMFFISKKMEGCTDKTLEYYSGALRRFFSVINSSLQDITADDIRLYLAKRSIEDKLSKCSQDNELRVLKSFFKWCSGEGYIDKMPTLNIKSIKKEKKVKKAFTEMQVEILRQNAAHSNSDTYIEKLKSARNLAIIDVLFSTGVRISELVDMNISEIQSDEIVVFGKGEKERIVYLNAKALLSLEKYMEIRVDDCDALFVSAKKPYTRLKIGAVETMIRELGKKAGVKKAHPHRFRRTAATVALNRGMPIEQVAQMLGHESIETTTIYARSEKENVKANHRKYVV